MVQSMALLSRNSWPDAGIVMLLRNEIELSERERADESARSCPVAALRTRADFRGRSLVRLENTAETKRLIKYATCAQQGKNGDELRALLADEVASVTDATHLDRRTP